MSLPGKATDYPTATAQVTLEIMSTSIAATRAALAGGADRIELCDNYAEGGTTPSAATIAASAQLAAEGGVPVMAMIRPRGGGFCYDRDERAVMAHDLLAALREGATGVVFGCLDRNGEVDEELTRALVDLAGPAPVTFHRAVDVSADPVRASTRALELGCRRVLTSGGAETALAGSATIARMVAQARPGAIIAGAGVSPANVAELVRVTGVTQVHASAKAFRTDGGWRDSRGTGPGLDTGPGPQWPAGGWPAPDPLVVGQLRAALRAGPV